MDPEELYETTMNPANRHLIPLTTNDFERTIQLYNKLMGNQPSARRDFILSNHLSRIGEDGDIFEDDEIADDMI